MDGLKVNPSSQISTIKQALDLLCKARICHRVTGCAGNGVPLAAEVLEKYLKVIFLDVGLTSSTLGLSLSQISSIDELIVINNGAIAEQVVGQLLRTIAPYYQEPSLYYWHRDEKGSSSEVDYLVQMGNKVIPVEVKAGTTGNLKSLHVFIGLKKLSFAIRINSDVPSITNLHVKDSLGNFVDYSLLSIPFYLLGQLYRLAENR